MKKFLIVIVSLFLAGCTVSIESMTNQEIISETRMCEDSGLRSVTKWRYGYIVKVICAPKIGNAFR